MNIVATCTFRAEGGFLRSAVYCLAKEDIRRSVLTFRTSCHKEEDLALAIIECQHFPVKVFSLVFFVLRCMVCLLSSFFLLPPSSVLLGILSYQQLEKRCCFEERRLLASARERGCKARIFRVDKCQLSYDPDQPRIWYDTKPFPPVHVLIPRVDVSSKVDLNVSYVKQFELMNVPVVNSYLPISRAKNKLRTLQILDHANIPLPKTVIVRGLAYVEWAMKAVGGPPVVLKTAFGSYGSGVVIAESRRGMLSALDAISRTSDCNLIIVQQYIKEAKRRDLRVFVVGEKIIAAMERRARPGDFRANAELGGAAVPVELNDAERSISLDAARAMQLDVVGVDVIRTNDGPAILEVNANPGFAILENVTGVSVAGAIIDHALTLAKAPSPEGV